MGIIFLKGLTQKLICLRFQKKKKKKFYFDSIYIIETTELGWLWTSMRSCHIYSYIFFGAARSYMLYAFETWN